MSFNKLIDKFFRIDEFEIRDNGPNRPDGNVKFCATDDEYRELDSFQFDGTIIGLNQ